MLKLKLSTHYGSKEKERGLAKYILIEQRPLPNIGRLQIGFLKFDLKLGGITGYWAKLTF